MGEGGAVPTSTHQLRIEIIPKRVAQNAYDQWHYLSGKGFLATYNFGVFYNGELQGAISYGIPNSPHIKGVYTESTQGEYLELTRLALSDVCPKNSESRVIALTLKMLHKNLPNLKGVITYADTAQKHTGIIYRATNFVYKGLTAPKTDLYVDGKKVGKLKGIKYSELGGTWLPRSQKHLFVYTFL
jgi:hypothetical protein